MSRAGGTGPRRGLGRQREIDDRGPASAAAPAAKGAGSGAASAGRAPVLDDLDRRIVRRLLVDGRSSARKMALEMGRATVTIASRMRRLERDGVVLGYSARVDSARLGYDLTAIIEVVAKKDMLVEVERAISEMPDVCAVYDVTGGTDVMVIAKFRSRADLSGFVKGLASVPHVESTNTRVALGTVKEDFRVG